MKQLRGINYVVQMVATLAAKALAAKALAGRERAFHARSAFRGCASREALPVSDFVQNRCFG
eukprot:5565524-Alexandrium_andersonii.AAC.1